MQQHESVRAWRTMHDVRKMTWPWAAYRQTKTCKLSLSDEARTELVWACCIREEPSGWASRIVAQVWLQGQCRTAPWAEQGLAHHSWEEGICSLQEQDKSRNRQS